MNLHEIRTEDLLVELARRCRVVKTAAVEVPGWALPVLRVVAGQYDISVAELLDASSRAAVPAEARHLAMTLLRERTERSFEEIGALWGQDYGTVIYGCGKIRVRVGTEGPMGERWRLCLEALGGDGRRRSSRQVPRARGGVTAV